MKEKKEKNVGAILRDEEKRKPKEIEEPNKKKKTRGGKR